MSVLDDFIAQDPTARDFVDLYGNVQWTETMVRDRTEQILEGYYNPQMQRIVGRKIDIYEVQQINEVRTALNLPIDPDLVLPAYVLSVGDKQQISDFAMKSGLCGALKDFMWARAQLVSDAISYESWRTFLDSLGPVPEPPEVDPNADVRTQLQGILDGFAQATKDLVAQRDAWRNPEPVVDPSAPVEQPA